VAAQVVVHNGSGWFNLTVRDRRSWGTRCSVFVQSVASSEGYLVVTADDGNTYLGSLIFERSNIAEAMYDFFLTQINRRVSEIGSIDIPLMNEKRG
jgi:hypothetical protein